MVFFPIRSAVELLLLVLLLFFIYLHLCAYTNVRYVLFSVHSLYQVLFSIAYVTCVLYHHLYPLYGSLFDAASSDSICVCVAICM